VPPRALLIAATDDAAAERASEALRARLPAAKITAITRAGSSLTADHVITATAEGPYGFILTPHLLRELRGGFDLAWAAVGGLSSPAYRRVALLLSLAKAKVKAAVAPGGPYSSVGITDSTLESLGTEALAKGARLSTLEVVSLDEWLQRSGISLGTSSLLRAGWRRMLLPYRRRRAARLLRGDRPPFGFRRVNIGVSDRCNHRCIMCSEHSPYCADGGRRMAAEGVLAESDFGLMEAEMYHALIRDLADMGAREVELCGAGEPMTHPSFLDFVRAAKAAGFWMRVVTNAGLLNEEKARELAALGVEEVHVSVNAGTAETYAKVHGTSPATFSRVLAAIRALADAHRELGKTDCRVETSFVVQALNYREPMQWVRAVAEAGSSVITFAALGAAPATAPVQLTPEQWEEAKQNVSEAVAWAQARGLHVRGTFGALADSGSAYSADLYADMSCYIGHIYAIVMATGRIFPCCACTRVVGDLKQGGFAAAWRGETYRRFREQCLDLPNRLPGLESCSCMACPYGPWNVEFHRRLLG